MTEVNMEVDTAKPLTLDGQVDDDFIDFDTEMTEMPHTEVRVTEETVKGEADAPNDGGYDVSESDEYQGDHAMNEGGVDISVEETHISVAKVDETTEQRDFALSEKQEENDAEHVGLEEPLEDHHHNTQDDPGNESAHEIDYENENGSDGVEAEQFEVNLADDVAVENHNVDDDNHNFSGEPEPEAPESHETGSQQAADENEITWEEGDGNKSDIKVVENEQVDGNIHVDGAGCDAIDEQPEHQDFTKTDESTFDGGEEAVLDAENAVVEDETHFDNAEVGHDGPDEEHREENQPAAEVLSSMSSSRQDLDVATNTDFPAITVQYKGDEFPFFSTSSDGFFADLSVLDDSMESLLAGLREELANEISHEDELVFQVDELGLEFTESSSPESLTNVTLRQILEIFDLLVKNQDPDSSRTLYAYLFTKPNVSRRLESLIESATAGKGLDEVIHLFETPVQNTIGSIENNRIPDEQLDEYGSLDGEPSQDIEHDGDEIAEEAGETEIQDSAREEDQIDVQEDEHVVVDDQHDGIDYNVEEDVQEETAEAFEDATAAAIPEDAEDNEYAESESNPFVHLELDEEVTVTDKNTDPEVEAHDDAPYESEVAIDGTRDTSTTTTLKGDDEAASTNVDVVANTEVNEPMGTDASVAVAPDEAADDELAEIDWREELEPENQVPNTPSAVGKRPRTEDEFNVDDEKDVKRRRS